MNILLISPCLSTSDRYGSALGKVGPTTEPLGLAYLAAYLRQQRPKADHIEILDMAALNYGEEDLKKKLAEKIWDLTGVMILTPMYIRAKETIAIIKKSRPETKIVLGGPHATIFPEQTLEEISEIDYSVIGEGEITFCELVNAIDKKKHTTKIPGLAYRQSGKVKMTKPRALIQNIDELPKPARDLLPMRTYNPAPTYYKK